MRDTTTTWTKPNGETVTWNWTVPEDPEDEPPAGVREPRRPRPDPSPVSVHIDA